MANRRIRSAAAWGCLVAGIVAASTADAQEQKAYKYLDEKGNVIYSQKPPPGKNAREISIAPAYEGSGAGTPRGPRDDPNRYSADRQEQQQNALREKQRVAEEARKKRLADLEAECNRNRGIDCRNPETLRLMESNQVPGGRRVAPAR